MSVRAHMAQYRIDMQRLQLRVFGGAVRVAGEAFRIGGHQLPLSGSALESFEREVVMTRGVRRASFEFENWKRRGDGVWEPLEPGQEDVGDSAKEEQGPLSLHLVDELEA